MHVDYPLEWFDDLIMNTIDRRKVVIEEIEQLSSKDIKERADLESSKIKRQLKRRLFMISSREETEVIVRQYHSSLIMLYDYSMAKNHLVSDNPHLKSSYEHVLSRVDELISFIESRFFQYLNEEDQVPQSYLCRTQAEIHEKLPLLQKVFEKLPLEQKTTNIIIGRLHRFFHDEKQPIAVTFKEIQYQKELMQNLCKLDVDSPVELDYTALDRMLIYLNYNSKSYIGDLRSRILKRVHQSTCIPVIIDQLSLSYKVFSQLFRKSDVKLNPTFQGIHRAMTHWFSEEIAYLERKMHLSAIPLNSQVIKTLPSHDLPVGDHKLLCTMSTDQIALALSAMDDLRILKAKSKSKVFQTIVPFLSTPNKDELSPGAMRSKSYSPEEGDKEVLIKNLERMIQKIKEY